MIQHHKLRLRFVAGFRPWIGHGDPIAIIRSPCPVAFLKTGEIFQIASYRARTANIAPMVTDVNASIVIDHQSERIPQPQAKTSRAVPTSSHRSRHAVGFSTPCIAFASLRVSPNGRNARVLAFASLLSKE